MAQREAQIGRDPVSAKPQARPRPILRSLVPAALALALVAGGCAGDERRRVPAGEPPPAPAATAPTSTAVDGEGLLTTAAGGSCLHWRPADGTDYELVGPRAGALSAELVVDDHPVRIEGRTAGSATSCGDPRAITLEVDRFDFRAVYATAAVAPGLTWRSRRFDALFGATQSINFLEVDVRRPGVTIRPVQAPGGVVTSRIGTDAGATAAVNGGFFSSSYAATGLLKIGGRVVATNPAGRPARSAVGFSPPDVVLFERLAPGDPWAAVSDALGAGPSLVAAGRVDVTRAAEGMSSYLDPRHPRTAIGARADGHVVLLTADGRTAAGAGVTLEELARLLRQLGCEQAINLDGGGSTTMWVRGQPEGGVVSYPSDNRTADHRGERRVANALVVHTP